MYTLHTRFRTFGADLNDAQSVIINTISASELSRKIIKIVRCWLGRRENSNILPLATPQIFSSFVCGFFFSVAEFSLSFSSLLFCFLPLGGGGGGGGWKKGFSLLFPPSPPKKSFFFLAGGLFDTRWTFVPLLLLLLPIHGFFSPFLFFWRGKGTGWLHTSQTCCYCAVERSSLLQSGTEVCLYPTNVTEAASR